MKMHYYDDQISYANEKERKEYLINKYNQLANVGFNGHNVMLQVYSMKLYKIFDKTNVYCSTTFTTPKFIKDNYISEDHIIYKHKPIQIQYHIQLSDSQTNNAQANAYINAKIAHENKEYTNQNVSKTFHYSVLEAALTCNYNTQ